MAETNQAVQPLNLGDEPGGKRTAAKRKPHRKSRTGCRQCRASRVKCDETKPSCSYCVRHSVECSFLSTEPNLLPSISGLNLTGRTASPARRVSESTTGEGSPHSESGSPSLCTNLHMRDMELLLHFTTATAPTISAQNPASNGVWSLSVPHIALEHPFLMHGILGIGALHLSRLKPERQQEYALLAAKHENIALPLFRAESANVTERNVAATFAFAALVVIYAMASPNHAGGGLFFPGPESGDGLPEWLHLLRGVDAITRPRRHLVLKTALAPLIDMDRYQHRVLSPSDEIPLSVLSTLFTIPPDCTPSRVSELEVYREAFSFLRDSFTNPSSPYVPSQPVPYIWFTLISEEYLQFLSQRRPEALVLLAYECVILKRMEPCWFVDGVADRLMHTVMENLRPEWRFCVEWPLQEMGMGYD